MRSAQYIVAHATREDWRGDLSLSSSGECGVREYVMNPVEMISGCFDPAFILLKGNTFYRTNWGITVETAGNQTHELEFLVIKPTAIRKTCQ